MSRLDRFDNYRGILAKYASTATCGHAVKVGDSIGYNARLKRAGQGGKTVCADCWRKWQAENAEAEAYEQSERYCGYGY